MIKNKSAGEFTDRQPKGVAVGEEELVFIPNKNLKLQCSTIYLRAREFTRGLVISYEV